MKKLLFCSLLLTSCTFHRLQVQTQYLSHEDLASYHVQTPDPHIECPLIGQRLLIQWGLPACYLAYEDLKLTLKVRLRNRHEHVRSLVLKETKGTYLYRVINNVYRSSGGIATYKVEITGGGQVLETWKHPLWVDLIHVGQSSYEGRQYDQTPPR